ncbi:hypothetical protein [Bryocella elongata]|uniref:hypothetical protein n=1 Tax=Bryocella elongata TaxID=863522 RepID=UPI001357743B|nr:hypothetical protein [Bryocella elongata]
MQKSVKQVLALPGIAEGYRDAGTIQGAADFEWPQRFIISRSFQKTHALCR